MAEAEESQLEKTTNEEHKKLRKKGFFSSLVSGAFYTGLAGLATYAGMATVGIAAPVTGLAFAAGSFILNTLRKEKKPEEEGLVNYLKEYTIGTLAGIAGAATYKAADIFFPAYSLTDKIVKGVIGATVGNMIYTAAYVPFDHFIKHGFSGIVQDFANRYWPITRDTIIYLGLPVALTINGYLGGYFGIVAMDTAFRIIAGLASGKAEKKEKPEPIHKAAAQLAPAGAVEQ